MVKENNDFRKGVGVGVIVFIILISTFLIVSHFKEHYKNLEEKGRDYCRSKGESFYDFYCKTEDVSNTSHSIRAEVCYVSCGGRFE